MTVAARPYIPGKPEVITPPGGGDEVDALIDELGLNFFGTEEKVDEKDLPSLCSTCPTSVMGRDIEL